jgi:NADH-quinone oxidoreductase subunit M
MPVLPEAWRRYALVFVVIGVVSIVYGALVALAQDDLKRMIAYTSVNHMGYVLLGLGAAGVLSGGDADAARAVAVTGAVTQMVSHGLITAALFLLAGVLDDRGHSYDMRRYGGLAGPMPRLAALFAVGAFASLGIPGFTGFLAEFQVFAGSLATVPVAAAIGLLGILLTAALFLGALQRVFTGPPGELTEALGTARSGRLQVLQRVDVDARELAAVVPLLLLALVLGVFPRPLLDLIEPAARTVTELVSR